MHENEMPEFDALIHSLCVTFNREHAPDLTKNYFKALSWVPLAAIQQTVDKLMTTATSFPVPRVIIDIAVSFMAVEDPYSERSRDGKTVKPRTTDQLTKRDIQNLMAKVAERNSAMGPTRQGLPHGCDTLAGALLIALAKIPYTS